MPTNKNYIIESPACYGEVNIKDKLAPLLNSHYIDEQLHYSCPDEKGYSRFSGRIELSFDLFSGYDPRYDEAKK